MRSLTRVAVLQRRGVKPIHPLALNPAIWLDATDASTLFVDEAGAQPVVLGDPVGRWKNKGVGGGAYYAKMVSSATRPIYTAEGVSGVGNSSGYLQFNFALKQPFEMLFCSKLNIDQGEAYSGVPARGRDKWISLTADRSGAAGPRVSAKDMASTSASASSNGTFQEAINPVDTTQPHVAGFASQDRQTSNYNNVSWNGVAKEYQADFEIDCPDDQRLFQNNQPTGSGNHLTTAHVIMFNRILTEEERAGVAAWMLENNNL